MIVRAIPSRLTLHASPCLTFKRNCRQIQPKPYYVLPFPEKRCNILYCNNFGCVDCSLLIEKTSWVPYHCFSILMSIHSLSRIFCRLNEGWCTKDNRRARRFTLIAILHSFFLCIGIIVVVAKVFCRFSRVAPCNFLCSINKIAVVQIDARNRASCFLQKKRRVPNLRLRFLIQRHNQKQGKNASLSASPHLLLPSFWFTLLLEVYLWFFDAHALYVYIVSTYC